MAIIFILELLHVFFAFHIFKNKRRKELRIKVQNVQCETRSFLLMSQIKQTLLTAIVLLQHHNTPPLNSDEMLLLFKTCLKSDSFNSFMNVV